ncbi:MAG TPA: pitrilysin family protein [Candidatus Acidoferrales bacterium]|nr:pitrilysin family protein [Candidatus Acidoferrales bacterium]
MAIKKMIYRNRSVVSPKKVRVNVDFKEYKLDNGLTVILRKDFSMPVVAVDVCYHVGSKNEKEGKTGFAHLFEHLMFEGSEHVEKGAFDKYISLAGGYNNAYTTEDVTNYYEVIPSNQLALALWLESDRMLKFSVTGEALSTQREVVKEEKRWRIDNRPYGDASERMQNLVFPVGQYHWPVIGSMEDLDAANMDDVREFYERFYCPNNAVLVVSGSIDFKPAEDLIGKFFSDIPPGRFDIKPVLFEDEKLGQERVEIMRGNVPSPGVFVAYKVPPEGSPEYYALCQIGKILSDGNSSRLYQKLIYETQAVSDFDVSIEAMEKSGVFMFTAFVAPGHSEREVLEIFDDEINRLQESQVTEYEFNKAQNTTISSYIGRLSTNSGVADALSHYYSFFKNTGMINSEVDRELAVTASMIHEIAGKFLKKDERVILNYFPGRSV